MKKKKRGIENTQMKIKYRECSVHNYEYIYNNVIYDLPRFNII